MTVKKQRILEAATVLFAEKGFKDTSIAELAGITDTAQGTIFYHFKNKFDGIFFRFFAKINNFL